MKKNRVTTSSPWIPKPGCRVFVIGGNPWKGHAGNLVAYETYGLCWQGWRVQLDSGNQCYASLSELRSAEHV